jgi:hypothetical protein
MTLHFTPIPTDTVRTYRAGGLDANGQPPPSVIWPTALAILAAIALI